MVVRAKNKKNVGHTQGGRRRPIVPTAALMVLVLLLIFSCKQLTVYNGYNSWSLFIDTNNFTEAIMGTLVEYYDAGAADLYNSNSNNAISGNLPPQPQSTALPPIHIGGSWIGNQWIPPPGYKLYSAQEILQYFQHRSVLVVGDSTARRQYATLYGILQSAAAAESATTAATTKAVPLDAIDHEDVLGGSANNIKCESNQNLTWCRPMPHSDPSLTNSNTLDFLAHACLGGLQQVVEDPESILYQKRVDSTQTSNSRRDDDHNNPYYYDLVLFVLGPWEVMERVECGAGHLGRKNQTQAILQTLFEREQQQQQQQQQHQQIVWRTWGSAGSTQRLPRGPVQDWKKARAHNRFLKQLIDQHDRAIYHAGTPEAHLHHQAKSHLSSVSYIDWGQVMLPRLYPEAERISGDIDPHYGLEARLTYIQMLMNHLTERNRQERQHLVPWKIANNLHHRDQSTRISNKNQKESSALTGDVVDNDDENGDDAIGQAFLTTTPPKLVLSPEEERAFENAKADFCPECSFHLVDKVMPCLMRKEYLQYHYLVPEPNALFSIMKDDPGCNNSFVAAAATTHIYPGN